MLKFPLHRKISTQAQNLIKALLIKDPEKRLGHNDIEEIMQHEFFADIQWDSVLTSKVPYDPPVRPPRRAMKT